MSEDANDRYERLAAAFKEDTGHVAPGKDDPLPNDYSQREDAWYNWRVGMRRGDAARDAEWRAAVAYLRKGYLCEGELLNGRSPAWGPCGESECADCQVTNALDALLAAMDTPKEGA